MLDPFGITAFGEITRYWTVFDRNYVTPEFSGTLAYNRFIWLGAGALALVLTSLRYRFDLSPARLRLRRLRKRKEQPAPAVSNDSFTAGAGGLSMDLSRLRSQLRMDIRGMVRSVPFYVLLAFGMFNVLGGFYGAVSQLFGTPIYPVTGVMILIVAGSFSLAVLVILIYYSGELVHRERQSHVNEIIDATPYPNWIMVVSKIGALWFVISAMLFVVMLSSIAVQALNDYHEYEIGLYLQGMFGMIGSWYYLLCVPAVFIQVLSPNKFLGMIVFLLLFLGVQTLPSLDFQHNLYLYRLPSVPYSGMNGWGHFVTPLLTLGAYWLTFAGLLTIAAHLLFQRGYLDTLRGRLAVARERVTPVVLSMSAGLLVIFVGLGSWIFYNTNVLNDYITTDEGEKAQADYEIAYKQFKDLPHLDVASIDMAVDLFPAERRLESIGTALLVNRNSQAVADFHVTVSPLLSINKVEIAGATLATSDEKLGYYQYQFDEPLPPNAEIPMTWDLSWINEGYENSGGTTRVVENGAFVNNTEIMPLPGYFDGRELTDNNVRREYGLGPVERAAKLNDPKFLGVNQLGVSERTDFRAVMSTASDQIAIAPGYLQREWSEGGRRYFEYEMDAKIWPFVSFSSARYAVTRDEWNDVALEVYHHPAHSYNVDAMIKGSKRALEYFSREFSPYQYRQFRILEFPRYQTFAQSFPNTIPFSEAIGFLADLRDEKNIDYVFYVTAHELAHQWWAHQAIGADMQGATVIVETLAQYSALMVMEQEYGPSKMRRFLKYELDNYLRSRGSELIEELPLKYVENQGYIHYRKGSVVLYALKDAIGEEKVNQALRSFLGKHAFKSAPFPTSENLIDEFRAVAGEEHQALISDLFEKIVLFDLKVQEAEVAETAEGFTVTMTISARKLEADGAGRETEVDLEQMFDLAIFPEAPDELGETDLPEPILMQQQLIKTGEQTLTFTVAQRPARVGIDPYNKMIDRDPEDNLKSL